jgi:hypothetical protein
MIFESVNYLQIAHRPAGALKPLIAEPLFLDFALKNKNIL